MPLPSLFEGRRRACKSVLKKEKEENLQGSPQTEHILCAPSRCSSLFNENVASDTCSSEHATKRKKTCRKCLAFEGVSQMSLSNLVGPR